ncbi:MAG: HAD family hydrolase [Polyangiaceae bacterium]
MSRRTTTSLSGSEPVEVLLFDAGNTLVFLDAEVVVEHLADLGYSLEITAILAAQGPAHARYAERVAGGGASHEDGWQLFMATLLTTAGLPEGAVAEAVGHLRAEHDRFNLWRRVPPEVPVALARARDAGFRLGVVSNSEGQLLRLLERLDLLAPFEVVVDSGVEGSRKPDPAIFHLATSRLGVDPRRCLYAGDIPDVDVVGARGAGLDGVLIDALGVHPGYLEAPRYTSILELVTALASTPGG